MKAVEFCDISGAVKRDRFVIEKMFKDLDLDFKDWKKILKNDFASIKSEIFEEEKKIEKDFSFSKKEKITNEIENEKA